MSNVAKERLLIKEAKEVLEKAQKDYLDTRESILEEIDTLTKKRAEAERLYNLQK